MEPDEHRAAADELIERWLASEVGDAMHRSEIRDPMEDTDLRFDEVHTRAMEARAEMLYPAAKELDDAVRTIVDARRRSGLRKIIGDFRVDQAVARWRKKLVEDGILPVLRQLVNERLEPMLWNTMRVTEAPGLDRLRDADFVVYTGARGEFSRAAKQIGWGAIGVAGPRGAGKTTLIEAHLREHGRDGIGVLVAAPIDYEARDFMLHLYATTCRAVIDWCAQRKASLADSVAEARRASVWSELRTALWRLALLVLVSVAAAVGAVPTYGWTTVIRVATRPADWDVMALRDVWFTGVCLVAAVVLALGLLLALYRATANAVSIAIQVNELVGRRMCRRLLAATGPRLRQIRYLQTRTSGWSGKLTMPGGADAGWTRSVQHAERPLTFPEIVAELREFLSLIATCVAADPAVVVAVDELDKIDDAERARKFVNEVKGAFGARGTLFVVSVSDDALAAFERRGMPIRDAFDSAFDEIVAVHPFGVFDSHSLLTRRVIGMPDSFVYLAHCLAGGIPRDLIRTARLMVYHVGSRRCALAEVCAELVRQDLVRKAYAFQLATGELDASADTTAFIRALRRLQTRPDELADTLPDLLDGMPTGDPGFDLLRQQAGAFAYHSATLLDFFGDTLTEDRLLHAERTRDRALSLDHLAAARQALTVHPELARLMLDEFRQAWDLPLIGDDGVSSGSPPR